METVYSVSTRRQISNLDIVDLWMMHMNILYHIQN